MEIFIPMLQRYNKIDKTILYTNKKQYSMCSTKGGQRNSPKIIIVFIVLISFFYVKDGFAQQHEYIDVGEDTVIIDSTFTKTMYEYYSYKCYMANSLNYLYREYDHRDVEPWGSKYFKYDLYNSYSRDFDKEIKCMNDTIIEYLDSFNIDISYIKEHKFKLLLFPNSKGEILHSHLWSDISLLKKMSPQEIKDFFAFIKTLKLPPSKRANEKLYTQIWSLIWRGYRHRIEFSLYDMR